MLVMNIVTGMYASYSVSDQVRVTALDLKRASLANPFVTYVRQHYMFLFHHVLTSFMAIKYV